MTKNVRRLALVLGAALCLQAGVAQAQTRGGDAAARQAALTDLTPENSILVYVDFNSGLDNLMTAVPGPQYRANVQAFAAFADVFDMPKVVLGDEGDFYGPFYPEITKIVNNGAKRFHRTAPSGFTPEFASWLKSTGRKNVIIGGISIDNCTMHTSLDLLRAGYNVFVLIDVSPTNSPIAYNASIMRLQTAGAIPTSWVTMATDLVGDWNSANGAKLRPILISHLAPSTIGQPIDVTPDGFGFGSVYQQR
jgi:hypothetical protein